MSLRIFVLLSKKYRCTTMLVTCMYLTQISMDWYGLVQGKIGSPEPPIEKWSNHVKPMGFRWRLSQILTVSHWSWMVFQPLSSLLPLIKDHEITPPCEGFLKLGYPELSSMFMGFFHGFFLWNHPFLGTPMYGNPQVSSDSPLSTSRLCSRADCTDQVGSDTVTRMSCRPPARMTPELAASLLGGSRCDFRWFHRTENGIPKTSKYP